MTITAAAPVKAAAPHLTWFDDAHRIIDAARQYPCLPVPTIHPVRAYFDYTHIVHAELARQSVASARTVLGGHFGAVFNERTETGADHTPRYLLEALLDSGIVLCIVSRVSLADDPAEARPMAEAAAA